jgi:hypothetical protein
MIATVGGQYLDVGGEQQRRHLTNWTVESMLLSLCQCDPLSLSDVIFIAP